MKRTRYGYETALALSDSECQSRLIGGPLVRCAWRSNRRVRPSPCLEGRGTWKTVGCEPRAIGPGCPAKRDEDSPRASWLRPRCPREPPISPTTWRYGRGSCKAGREAAPKSFLLLALHLRRAETHTRQTFIAAQSTSAAGVHHAVETFFDLSVERSAVHGVR